MAIWQYTFKLIPRNELTLADIGMCLSDDDYERYQFWKHGDYSLKFFEPLIQNLPDGESWSNDLKLYGSLESNCVEIFTNDNLILEVAVRIDYTTNYSALLNKVIEFCSFKSLVLLDESNIVLPLNATTIEHTIMNSEQFIRFKTLSNKL